MCRVSCALGFSQDRASATKWLLKWCEKQHIGMHDVRFRNQAGCTKCLSQQGLFGAGYAGRTVVSEIIEPLRFNGFAQAIEAESMTQLISLIYGDTQVMQVNQRVRQRGLQKVVMGEIDPREIDRRFGEGIDD
jgi:general secretion pathway protein E